MTYLCPNCRHEMRKDILYDKPEILAKYVCFACGYESKLFTEPCDRPRVLPVKLRPRKGVSK